MQLFDGLPERPRVVVSGALRLARILPILRVIETPFVGDLEAIVLGCEVGDIEHVSRWVHALEYWRTELAESNDVLLPSYYQAVAVAVGLLVINSEDRSPFDTFSKINANVGNFWNCCDHLVDRVGGFGDVRLSGLKTTLRGVEDLWFQRDVELLSRSNEPGGVLRARLRDIEGKAEMRNVMAEVIVDCAQWK